MQVTEKDLPVPFGHPAQEAESADFLMQAQHWRAHSEALYAGEVAAWSLEVKWLPRK